MTPAFGTEGINLTIADYAIVLPADFDNRGVGIYSMLNNAEHKGRRLEVSSGVRDLRTTDTCRVPHVLKLGG